MIEIIQQFGYFGIFITLFSEIAFMLFPLPGDTLLFAFGIFSKREIRYKFLIPLIALLSPILCYILSENSEFLFSGYKFGFELLLINGVLTYFGLFCISTKTVSAEDKIQIN